MERCHPTYIEQGDPVSLEELGAKLCGRSETKTYSAYIEACIHGLLKVHVLSYLLLLHDSTALRTSHPDSLIDFFYLLT